MIDWVFAGHCWDPLGTEELRFGWNALQRDLAGAQVEFTQAVDLQQLWATARQHVLAQPELKDSAPVLLLKHVHVMLAPDCLARLRDALSAAPAQPLVQGFDSAHPCPDAPIDYATVRGVERYATRLHNDVRSGPVDTSRLLSLTTVGALRSYGVLSKLTAGHVCAAFGHDFSDYHSGKREEVIPLVPTQAARVLDVGGGAGGFLQALQAARPCETHLAEFSPQACAAARPHVGHVWQGDFLTHQIDARFDCITFLDVLEHIENPLTWLERAKSLLTKDGCVVASIPNVGHWSVVADLLEGRWDYAPVGIHCITHLRFYTRHGISALFEQAGLVVEHVEPTRLPMPAWWSVSSMGGRLTLDEDSLNTYAFLVSARPKDAVTP